MTLTKEEIEMIEREAKEYSLYYSVGDYPVAIATYRETATKYLLQLKAERERAGKLMGNDNPFPLNDVLRLLINATWILLYKKDYDGPDYEEMETALKRAKETQEAINEYNNTRS